MRTEVFVLLGREEFVPEGCSVAPHARFGMFRESEWWRRRESNPRLPGRRCAVYMLSIFFDLAARLPKRRWRAAKVPEFRQRQRNNAAG